MKKKTVWEEFEMKKALIAYFSAEGNTRKLAERMAAVSGTDLFEIAPEEIYTREDLDWRNKNSRSSLEMNDLEARPKIEGKVVDMDQYDTVFVGFPIWWYREPSIIDTFLESYDFTGKKIVPFATSGSSGMGDTVKYMKRILPDADIAEGKRFSKKETDEELKSFIENDF